LTAGPRDSNITRILCHGSITTAKWGVGSDLDVIIVVRETNVSFERRAADYPVEGISVPVDLMVYTEREFGSLREEGRRIAAELDRNALTLFERAQVVD